MEKVILSGKYSSPLGIVIIKISKNTADPNKYYLRIFDDECVKSNLCFNSKEEALREHFRIVKCRKYIRINT